MQISSRDFRPSEVIAFAGGGGSALGSEAAGADIKCMIEWVPNNEDGQAQKQYPYQHLVKNFPALAKKRGIINKNIKTVFAVDIMAISGLEPYELDIYQSSFPCQGFSSCNHEDDDYNIFADPRNNLYRPSVKHVLELKPKVVIFENVVGLSNGKKLGIFSNIIRLLEKAGYKVKAFILNASNYGSPQSRPRLFFIAIRDDICNSLNIKPTPPPYADKVVCICNALPNIAGIRNLQYNRNYHPASGFCPTLTKTPNILVKPRNEKFRKPSLEELCALSSWPSPKKYKFLYPNNYGINHAMLGNAVLPVMMEAITRHIIDKVLVPWYQFVGSTSKNI